MNEGHGRKASIYAVCAATTLMLVGLVPGAQAQTGGYAVRTNTGWVEVTPTPAEQRQQQCDDTWALSEASNYCGIISNTASDAAADNENQFHCSINANCSYEASIQSDVYNGEEHVRTDWVEETWTYTLDDEIDINDVGYLYLCIAVDGDTSNVTMDVQKESDCQEDGGQAMNRHSSYVFTLAVQESGNEGSGESTTDDVSND